MKNQSPVYIPHGGGPCFFMEWTLGPVDTWHRMAAWMKGFSGTLPQKPDAILAVSAHWENEEFCVGSHPHPPLIYDYHGFPDHTYRLRYSAPGDPGLAARTRELLEVQGITCIEDSLRGFDHGIFVPFLLMFPDADIPVVQLSLKSGLDPAFHIRAGKAIESLRRDNVLIIGSGMSSHNLAAMFDPVPEIPGAEEFDAWLNQACAAPAEERERYLCNWTEAPFARQMHPREEHLLPLMVAAGAAESSGGRNIFSDRVMGAIVSAIQFS